MSITETEENERNERKEKCIILDNNDGIIQLNCFSIKANTMSGCVRQDLDAAHKYFESRKIHYIDTED